MNNITKKDHSRSTEKALKLLDCFIAKEEWGISELARELDLGKASVSRLVAAFEGHKFLMKNEATEKYRLGIRLMFFGLLFQERNELTNVLAPIMQNLAQKYQATAHLGVQYGTEVLIISKTSAGSFFYMVSRIGATLSSHASASGKCLLAYQDPEQIEQYLKKASLNPLTEKTITDPKSFIEELAIVRQQGYALDDEEYTEGLYCLAVPLLDMSGKPIAALSLSGSKETLKKREKEMAKDLIAEIKQLSF
jgi:DNA-binding IclR family transcriptional regulator